jgi:hypothetical protein
MIENSSDPQTRYYGAAELPVIAVDAGVEPPRKTAPEFGFDLGGKEPRRETLARRNCSCHAETGIRHPPLPFPTPRHGCPMAVERPMFAAWWKV